MIHIVQCLCPDRHCIFALAYDPADLFAPEAIQGFKEMVQVALDKKIANPWCGICGSTLWSYEDTETQFATIEEARPALKESEADQAATRAILGKY